MSATRLEKRIAEVAEATGRNVYVGRKGHKEDWFAGCGDIEVEAPTASGALAAVVVELQLKVAATEALYRSEARLAERVGAL